MNRIILFEHVYLNTLQDRLQYKKPREKIPYGMSPDMNGLFCSTTELRDAGSGLFGSLGVKVDSAYRLM